MVKRIEPEEVAKWVKWIENREVSSFTALHKKANRKWDSIKNHLQKWDDSNGTDYLIQIENMNRDVQAEVAAAHEGKDLPDEVDLLARERAELAEALKMSRVTNKDLIMEFYFNAANQDWRNELAWLNICMKDAGVPASNRNWAIKAFFKRPFNFAEVDGQTTKTLEQKYGQQTAAPGDLPFSTTERQKEMAADIAMDKAQQDVEERDWRIHEKKTKALQAEIDLERHRRALQQSPGGDVSTEIIKAVLPGLVDKPSPLERVQEFKAMSDMLRPQPQPHELEMRKSEATARMALQERMESRLETFRQESQQYRDDLMNLRMERSDDKIDELKQHLLHAQKSNPIKDMLRAKKELEELGISMEKDGLEADLTRKGVERIEEQIAQVRLDMAEMSKDLVYPMARLWMLDTEYSIAKKHNIPLDKYLEMKRGDRQGEEDEIFHRLSSSGGSAAGGSAPQTATPPVSEEITHLENQVMAREAIVQKHQGEMEVVRQRLTNEIQQMDVARSELLDQITAFQTERDNFRAKVESEEAGEAPPAQDEFLCPSCGRMFGRSRYDIENNRCIECSLLEDFVEADDNDIEAEVEDDEPIEVETRVNEDELPEPTPEQRAVEEDEPEEPDTDEGEPAVPPAKKESGDAGVTEDVPFDEAVDDEAAEEGNISALMGGEEKA